MLCNHHRDRYRQQVGPSTTIVCAKIGFNAFVRHLLRSQKMPPRVAEHIASGGSRSFPRGGGANSPGGRQHMILPNFPKNCMKLKEFGPPGGRASKILLCRSATDCGSWMAPVNLWCYSHWRFDCMLFIVGTTHQEWRTVTITTCVRRANGYSANKVNKQ